MGRNLFPFGKSRCPFSAYELSCVKRRNEKEIKRRRNIRNATPRKAASVKSIPSSDFTFCLMHLIPGTRITEIPNIVLEKQFQIGDCWNSFLAMVLILCPCHGIFDALFDFFQILVDFESAHYAYPYIKSFISWVYLRFIKNIRYSSIYIIHCHIDDIESFLIHLVRTIFDSRFIYLCMICIWCTSMFKQTKYFCILTFLETGVTLHFFYAASREMDMVESPTIAD